MGLGAACTCCPMGRRLCRLRPAFAGPMVAGWLSALRVEAKPPDFIVPGIQSGAARHQGLSVGFLA